MANRTTHMASKSDKGGSSRPSGFRKRKSTETEESQRKLSRDSLTNSAEFTETVRSSLDNPWKFQTNSIGPEPERRRRSKKKASEEEEGPRKRIKLTQDPSDGLSQHSSSSDSSGTSLIDSTNDPDPKYIFEAKYDEGELLGEGGFGSVYAGTRIEDNLPVAIKQISQDNIERLRKLQGTKKTLVPLEIELMLKLKPAAGERSFAIELLDWYDIDGRIILVLERPVPCCDLVDYLVDVKGSSLPEHEAQAITTQLVDAVIEIHSKGVFHNDLKLDNILIERGSEVPRVRLIDFGCGTFLTEEIFVTPQGTHDYTSPEWFTNSQYRAEPATVWQIGVTLFVLLHEALPFNHTSDIVKGSPNLNESLSNDCQSFLLSCLAKVPENRPSLEALKNHTWLNPSTQEV